jgi:hypothetical protein
MPEVSTKLVEEKKAKKLKWSLSALSETSTTSLSEKDKKKQKREQKRSDESTLALSRDRWNCSLKRRQTRYSKKVKTGTICVGILCGRFRKELVYFHEYPRKAPEAKR